MQRTLPSIIGTAEFESSDFAGLQELSDHEQEEDAIIASDTESVGLPAVPAPPAVCRVPWNARSGQRPVSGARDRCRDCCRSR